MRRTLLACAAESTLIGNGMKVIGEKPQQAHNYEEHVKANRTCESKPHSKANCAANPLVVKRPIAKGEVRPGGPNTTLQTECVCSNMYFLPSSH